MTSFNNMSKSLVACLPSTSSAASALVPINGSNDSEENPVSQLLNNFLPQVAISTCAPTAPPPSPYDVWSSPSSSNMPNPHGHVGREYANNIAHNHKEDNSSGSPGSNVSLSCFRCEEKIPTTRCVECNDLYCYECSHKSTSECHINNHTLLPIHQISPIGKRPHSSTNGNNDKEFLVCELHNSPCRFYCDPCIVFICEDCTTWVHKGHKITPVKGSVDVHRYGVFRAIEETKSGTKIIKNAIDRAVAVSKAYEKETTEANMKIRKAMRFFTQVIEEREKTLIEKVEKLRQVKMNDLSDHMNTLRGILAGLAHTNETLMRAIDAEGIELLIAKEKGRAQVEYYANTYRTMQLNEEKIVFVAPHYDLAEQLKRQCDVQSVQTTSTNVNSIMSSQISRQTISALQNLHSSAAYPPLSYNSPSTSSMRSLPDYSMNTKHNLYDHITTSYTTETNRGIGQAIAGYWSSIVMKPTRNVIPGAPMFSFAKEGSMEGHVSRPWGLCVDREGNIIVADRRNNRIQIFNCYGIFQSEFGSKGSGNGEFDLPAGITTDVQGRIIVIDKDNHRVQIFTYAGNFILKFGSFGKDCGQFQYPWDVAVNSLGNIVVTDTRNHRIQLFTSDGTFITKFVFEGPNPCKQLKGPTTPRGVCFTSTGNIIVSDFENHRLLMVDSSLSKIIQTVGREGSGIGELNRPSGIVTDDDGHIIVADSKNHRVLVFSADLRIMCAVDLKSPGLDDKDRPSDVALTPDGYLVVLFETLPDTARDLNSADKEYIKVY